MSLNEIEAAIQKIEHDQSLYNEQNFLKRAEAIDTIDFHIIDRIDGLIDTGNSIDQLQILRQSAIVLKDQLEAVDQALFQHIRQKIQNGCYRNSSFNEIIAHYLAEYTETETLTIGYDELDIFVNGILLSQPLPDPQKDREPGMIFYQQTPVRVILELIEKAYLHQTDLFYDIGSGLGHVAILVHIITGISAKGVEFEPAYSEYAAECANILNLTDITFINTDARNVDYADGTIFFLYSPFTGHILEEVLEKLQQVANIHPIRIFAYGPCVETLAKQGWLNHIGEQPVDRDILAQFWSR